MRDDQLENIILPPKTSVNHSLQRLSAIMNVHGFSFGVRDGFIQLFKDGELLHERSFFNSNHVVNVIGLLEKKDD